MVCVQVILRDIRGTVKRVDNAKVTVFGCCIHPLSLWNSRPLQLITCSLMRETQVMLRDAEGTVKRVLYATDPLLPSELRVGVTTCNTMRQTHDRLDSKTFHNS
jgi:hypothetical protein